jgi:hypothetical protein
MSDGFTIGAALNAPTIFQCPNCNETIDSTADSCRFCGVKVDHEAGSKAALVMAEINQACSDASYMKSCALALPVFFLLRFVPFLSFMGTVGFIGLLIVLPVWALRWWLKFAGIATEDSDFLRARNTAKITGIIFLLLFVLLVIAPFLFGILIAMIH